MIHPLVIDLTMLYMGNKATALKTSKMEEKILQVIRTVQSLMVPLSEMKR